jgi:pantothenate kinase
MCVIPDKIINMSSDNLAQKSSINAYVQKMIPGIFGEEVEEHYHKIKSEHELNLNGVKDTFNNFIFQYDTTGNPLEQTVADLGRMMNLRFRINAPRRPPRVIILGPPGSGRSTTAEIVSQRFGLVNVSPM